MTIIAPPMDHRDGTGREKAASQMDVLIRMMSMQNRIKRLRLQEQFVQRRLSIQKARFCQKWFN